MRHTLLAALGTMVAWVSGAPALEPTRLEIGTSMGLSYMLASESQDGITSFGIPGASSFLGAAGLYVTSFPSPQLLVEPQLHLEVLSTGSESFSMMSGILQIGYLHQPSAPHSPYVAVHGGGLVVSNGSSETLGAVGFAVGHRSRIGPGGALRVEGRYRRWISEVLDLNNEVAVLLGLGGVFQ